MEEGTVGETDNHSIESEVVQKCRLAVRKRSGPRNQRSGQDPQSKRQIAEHGLKTEDKCKHVLFCAHSPHNNCHWKSFVKELYTDPGENNLLTSSASGKEPICQCRRRKRRGFDP